MPIPESKMKEFDTSHLPLVKLSWFEEEMYSVIDDIDTYDDIAKEDFKLFRNLVMKRIREFHDKKLVFSDGYELWKSARLVKCKTTEEQFARGEENGENE